MLARLPFISLFQGIAWPPLRLREPYWLRRG
jgi:hypothetical protein